MFVAKHQLEGIVEWNLEEEKSTEPGGGGCGAVARERRMGGRGERRETGVLALK
jgi:hypothetical protein